MSPCICLQTDQLAKDVRVSPTCWWMAKMQCSAEGSSWSFLPPNSSWLWQPPPGVTWLLMDVLTALSYCYIGLIISPLKLLCRSQRLVVLHFFFHLWWIMLKDLRYWLRGISEAEFSWRILTSSELSGNLERHGFTWWNRLPSSWVSLCLAVLRKTKPFQWPNSLQFSPNNKDSVI